MEDATSQNPIKDGIQISTLADIKNPDVLQQLNAHVGMIGSKREYINPNRSIVATARQLATIGLTFDIPAMTETNALHQHLLNSLKISQ